MGQGHGAGRGGEGQHRRPVLTETHADEETARRFGRATPAAGFASNIASPGTSRSRGVATLGPDDVKRDPWDWPVGLKGRVASGILHTEGAEILVIGACLSCDSRELCEQQKRTITERIAAADLPSIVTGDFNATPYSEETLMLETIATYAHEHVGFEYVSNHTNCVGYYMVRHVDVRRAHTDTAFSDHTTVVATFEATAPLHFHAVEGFPRLTCPPTGTRSGPRLGKPRQKNGTVPYTKEASRKLGASGATRSKSPPVSGSSSPAAPGHGAHAEGKGMAGPRGIPPAGDRTPAPAG